MNPLTESSPASRGDDRSRCTPQVGGPLLLPLADEPPRERADAARNRARLLEAAARLMRERGAQQVTMDAVAAEACVGKGTVFRRFGDRIGLMLALLDHAEREFQQSFLSGPAPLGPGGEPRERLEAFGVALIRHILEYLDLYLEAEGSPMRRLSTAPLSLRRVHIAMLLRQAEVQGDAEILTEALLVFLDPALVRYLTVERGFSRERVEEGWRDLVRRTLGS